MSAADMFWPAHGTLRTRVSRIDPPARQR